MVAVWSRQSTTIERETC